MDTSINAYMAFEKCSTLDFDTVLDVGAGNGPHSFMFKDIGKKVTTIDFSGSDINTDYLLTDVKPHDLVWCSHVLEHQPNPNLFIKKLFSESKKYVCITVPPLKHEIVGGHVTLWNAGILLYQIILAGYNCVKASVKTYGYNISVIVEKDPIELPVLNYDFGDIELLSQYFPFNAKQGFNGQIEEINW
jgi:hypothetical protein